MALFLSSTHSLLSHPNPSGPLSSCKPLLLSLSTATKPLLRNPLRAANNGPSDPNLISGEWGEKAEPEAEPPFEADPPRNNDERGYLSGNGIPDGTLEDKLGDLKRCLVDSFYGVKAEISEIVNQLEAENPNPAPNETPELLDGSWVLLSVSRKGVSMPR